MNWKTKAGYVLCPWWPWTAAAPATIQYLNPDAENHARRVAHWQAALPFLRPHQWIAGIAGAGLLVGGIVLDRQGHEVAGQVGITAGLVLLVSAYAVKLMERHAADMAAELVGLPQPLTTRDKVTRGLYFGALVAVVAASAGLQWAYPPDSLRSGQASNLQELRAVSLDTSKGPADVAAATEGSNRVKY